MRTLLEVYARNLAHLAASLARASFACTGTCVWPLRTPSRTCPLGLTCLSFFQLRVTKTSLPQSCTRCMWCWPAWHCWPSWSWAWWLPVSGDESTVSSGSPRALKPASLARRSGESPSARTPSAWSEYSGGFFLRGVFFDVGVTSEKFNIKLMGCLRCVIIDRRSFYLR